MPLNNPSPGAALVSSGSYTGNGTVNLGRPHGLPKAPKLVIITSAGGAFFFRIHGGLAEIHYSQAAVGGGDHAVTVANSTYFYVGNVTDYPQSANDTGVLYQWTAIA